MISWKIVSNGTADDSSKSCTTVNDEPEQNVFWSMGPPGWDGRWLTGQDLLNPTPNLWAWPCTSAPSTCCRRSREILCEAETQRVQVSGSSSGSSLTLVQSAPPAQKQAGKMKICKGRKIKKALSWLQEMRAEIASIYSLSLFWKKCAITSLLQIHRLYNKTSSSFGKSAKEMCLPNLSPGPPPPAHDNQVC